MAVEIAIAMFNSDNPIGARIGDVIVSRPPQREIGRVERRLYIWIEIDDLADDDAELIAKPQYSDKSELIEVKKARFHMPFDELRKEYSLFDSLRAMNQKEVYQPFLNVDVRTGRISPNKRRRRLSGLLIDKSTDSPHVFREKR